MSRPIHRQLDSVPKVEGYALSEELREAVRAFLWSDGQERADTLAALMKAYDEALAQTPAAEPECRDDLLVQIDDLHPDPSSTGHYQRGFAAAKNALRAALAQTPVELDVNAVAHHLMRAGYHRAENRARREAAIIVLTAQTGDRYDLDDEYLTPEQRIAIARLESKANGN